MFADSSTSLLTVIDNKYARLVYYGDEQVIHHTFHNALDSEHLRIILNVGIDLLKEQGATRWLSDNREIDPHTEEDTNWINNNWLPRAIAAGWKYWALIVPHDVKAQMNMTEFIHSFYERGVRIMVFTELDEAKSWITKVGR